LHDLLSSFINYVFRNVYIHVFYAVPKMFAKKKKGCYQKINQVQQDGNPLYIVRA
jgi:hypothetical protein